MCFLVAIGFVSLAASIAIGMAIVLDIVLVLLGAVSGKPPLVNAASDQIVSLFWPAVILFFVGIICIGIANAIDD
jgi:hypothetical protein